MNERVQNQASYDIAQKFVSQLCADGIVTHDHAGEGDSSCTACDIRGKLASEIASGGLVVKW